MPLHSHFFQEFKNCQICNLVFNIFVIIIYVYLINSDIELFKKLLDNHLLEQALKLVKKVEEIGERKRTIDTFRLDFLAGVKYGGICTIF